MKKLESVKAWRYPCDKKVWFHLGSSQLCAVGVWYRKRRDLKNERPSCPCGKKCAPERIEIVVRRMGK